MHDGTAPTIERGLDGTTTWYHDMAVEGDAVERLLTELFTEHWDKLTVGPLIEGAAYEIQFAARPTVTMLDGYLTVDTGVWHFHLCVNDHRGARSEELARIRRVARAALFRTEGGSCSGTTWGLRLWNRSEEHTSELQSLAYLVCRLLLEKKKTEKRDSFARKPA